MKKLSFYTCILLFIPLIFSACSKEKGFELNSEQLIFNLDAMSVKGPIEKTAVANYDVDAIAGQYDIKVGGLETFKFKSIAFEIIEGDFRFDDLKYIEISITSANLPEKNIVSKIDIPAGTDKQFTVNAIPEIDVLQYAKAGDITMKFKTETTKDSTNAAKIKATPTIDAMGIAAGLLKN